MDGGEPPRPSGEVEPLADGVVPLSCLKVTDQLGRRRINEGVASLLLFLQEASFHAVS